MYVSKPSSTGVAAFEFMVEGSSTVYRLPRLNRLPAKEVARLNNVAAIKDETGRASAGLDAIISLFDKYAPGATDLMDTEQLMNVFLAWQEDSDITPGESKASTSSSESMAGRSTTISSPEPDTPSMMSRNV